MITLSTTHYPATDLGFLLHKHPDRLFSTELNFGMGYVVYPEASESRTTVALVLDIDPVKLVRGSRHAQGTLTQYVNDRPYVASSFLSVALGKAFRTAMLGKCEAKQELAESAIPLEVHIPVLLCKGGEDLITRLFQPLGYEIVATNLPLDGRFPEWGASHYYEVTLKAQLRLCEVLKHLYVLLPVLDSKRHYYLDQGEVDKLVSKGADWLPKHPEKEWIVRMTLGRKTSLIRTALEQLANVEEELAIEDSQVDDSYALPEESTEKRYSLHAERHDRVVEIVRELKPHSLIDLGCGAGELMQKLVPIKGLAKIVGMDVSYFCVEKAYRRLRLDDASPKLAERLNVFHGSLMYRDPRILGFEVATVVEVIEHLDQARLSAFEKIVFGYSQPKIVIVTTPNKEYNAVYGVEEMRHSDHRFEWTREEFNQWVERICEKYEYSSRIEGVGEIHPDFGQPSQLVVFSK